MKIPSQIIIYNGYNIRQLLSNLPVNVIKRHKKMYIKNCIEVYKAEESKTNLGHAERVRYSNFLLIRYYLNN